MLENLNIIAGIAATLIAVVSATVILTRHSNRIERKIDAIRDGLNQNIRQSNNIIGLFSTLIGLLSKIGVIDKDQFGTIIGEFAKIGRIGEVHPNPISIEETAKLNEYIRRAQQGGTFSREEVQEYSRLVRTLESEHPNDPNIGSLVTLAILLIGLYLLTKD